MTSEEIKNKISENNEKIEKASKPFIFTLNKTIQVLMADNEKLREKCPHEFDNGICKYCGKENKE